MTNRSTLGFATVVLLTVSSNCYANPEATTGQGTVQGFTMTTNHGRNVSAFLGIPFARPPTGDLRFKNPVAAEPWKGTYDATKDPSMCPQLENDKVVGDEDCLYLNVFTPELPNGVNTSLLPVMFHIFGGGLHEGASESSFYGPQYILDKDVVLVAPNYRLGVLGFLSTGDSNAPGNFGMKDQVLALRWVQENVEYFGGNPDKVTIFGNSAGGSCVYYLTLSDLANGLFHRYILQSGGLIRPFYKKNSFYIDDAKRLGKHLGCSTNTSSSFIDCLRKVDAATIVDTKAVFYDWDEWPQAVWVVTDEPDLEGAFFTEDPLRIEVAGKRKDLPFIAGVTRDEGLFLTTAFYLNETKFDRFVNDFDKALPTMIGCYNQSGKKATFTAALKSHYFNTDLPRNMNSLLSNLTHLISDVQYVYPLINLHERQHSLMRSPSYFYSFEYRGTFSYTYEYGGFNKDPDLGVAHADELIYLFPHTVSYFAALGKDMSETDLQMVDAMVQLFTSFAINGKPTTSNESTTDIWKPYSSQKNYLRIGNGSSVALSAGSSLHEDRMKFLREFPEGLTC